MDIVFHVSWRHCPILVLFGKTVVVFWEVLVGLEKSISDRTNTVVLLQKEVASPVKTQVYSCFSRVRRSKTLLRTSGSLPLFVRSLTCTQEMVPIIYKSPQHEAKALLIKFGSIVPNDRLRLIRCNLVVIPLHLLVITPDYVSKFPTAERPSLSLNMDSITYPRSFYLDSTDWISVLYKFCHVLTQKLDTFLDSLLFLE